MKTQLANITTPLSHPPILRPKAHSNNNTTPTLFQYSSPKLSNLALQTATSISEPKTPPSTQAAGLHFYGPRAAECLNLIQTNIFPATLKQSNSGAISVNHGPNIASSKSGRALVELINLASKTSSQAIKMKCVDGTKDGEVIMFGRFSDGAIDIHDIQQLPIERPGWESRTSNPQHSIKKRKQALPGLTLGAVFAFELHEQLCRQRYGHDHNTCHASALSALNQITGGTVTLNGFKSTVRNSVNSGYEMAIGHVDYSKSFPELGNTSVMTIWQFDDLPTFHNPSQIKRELR